MATSEDEIRILLIGQTGVGKSATGNTILGEECFESSTDFDSQTATTQGHSRNRFGKRLFVVDTPGLFHTDTTLLNKDIMLEVQKAFMHISPGPHAVILVVEIGRYCDQERATADLFIEWLGKDALKYFFVVFTGLDRLTAKCKTFEDTIKKTKNVNLQKLLQLCDNRYIAFSNNNKECSPNQVEDLLNMIDRNIRGDYGKYYTNNTFGEIEKAIKKKGISREDLRKALNVAACVALSLIPVCLTVVLAVFKVATRTVYKFKVF